jgi:hypothetical protein
VPPLSFWRPRVAVRLVGHQQRNRPLSARPTSGQRPARSLWFKGSARHRRRGAADSVALADLAHGGGAVEGEDDRSSFFSRGEVSRQEQTGNARFDGMRQPPVHPHVHAIASRGGWTKDGTWVPIPYIDSGAAARLFRHKVLRLLLAAGRIDAERVELILGWRHTSGFWGSQRGRGPVRRRRGPPGGSRATSPGRP